MFQLQQLVSFLPAPISVIIPTLNAADDLPELLSALTEGLGAGLLREAVISDGGSTDDTRRIASAAGAVWIEGPAGRGGQISRGAAAARGRWLLVLHADTGLPPGWSAAVAEAMTDDSRAHAFRLAFRARGLMARIVAGWANLRSGLLRLPYGDQGLLISRELLNLVGGYADIPLMEDVALAQALGRRVALMPVAVTTDATRFVTDGWIRRGARNLWTLARYLWGVPPEQLLRSYQRTRNEPHQDAPNGKT